MQLDSYLPLRLRLSQYRKGLKQIEVPTFDFNKINNFFKNVENIDESKKNKVFKLMNQINKLIEE